MPKTTTTITFVTGTRAEYGLMRSTLSAITRHPRLNLQIVATGMHLSKRHGNTLGKIETDGFPVATVVPWRETDGGPTPIAIQTGLASAALARTFARLGSQVVLIVGDRVEAFAAAAAAHLSRVVVAHIHGGDRALGQVDDSLRHAITKLAHIHFPATAASAARIRRLGEDAWRIQRVGSPGIDGIIHEAEDWPAVSGRFPQLARRRFALLVLHPVDADGAVEYRRAKILLAGLKRAGIMQIAAIYPNNDPGAAGIIKAWREKTNVLDVLVKDVPRPTFLGMLRGAAMLVGNSSSGIIEAASFGTPVVDIGLRQQGREHGRNVTHVEYESLAVGRVVNRIWRGGRPVRFPAINVYGGSGAANKIAARLANLPDREKLLRKLIAY